jgi:hypothetical protein
LAIGDQLPTMFGGTRPIQWIGHYPIKRRNPSKPWPKDARPVRIARSALAPNVPQTDLYLTQAHGLFIDGVLVSAGCLINETTITLDEASQLDALEFFHIKLEKHDVIYAEGAPVETLLEVDESAVNFAEYFRMHGAPTDEEVPCLPILSYWRRGSGLKSRVRSAVSWIDRRRQIGVIRHRLAQRGLILSRELQPST